MKTTVKFGVLAVLVEANDYQELTRQAWKIARLNEAAVQEGWELEDCLPYAETGADGNEYAGFIHLPTGRRIRFGKQKQQTGGDWFVRSRDNEHYRGPESFGDTSNQLPPAQSQHPALQGDGSSGEIKPPPDKAEQLREYLEKKMRENDLERGVSQARASAEKLSGQIRNRALGVVDEFARKLPANSFEPEDDLPF